MAAFTLGSSLLDAIVLSVVARSQAEGSYGYKITQDVQSVMDVSESTLYPVLRRLQKSGCLSTYDRACAGRNRRYYRITGVGQIQLTTYLIEWRDYRARIESVFFGGQVQ